MPNILFDARDGNWWLWIVERSNDGWQDGVKLIEACQASGLQDWSSTPGTPDRWLATGCLPWTVLRSSFQTCESHERR